MTIFGLNLQLNNSGMVDSCQFEVTVRRCMGSRCFGIDTTVERVDRVEHQERKWKVGDRSHEEMNESS